jgi:hypothetical protein
VVPRPRTPRRRSRAGFGTLLVAIVVPALLVLGAVQAGAAARAKLTVVSLSKPPKSVTAGNRFRITEVTRNLTAARVGRSTTFYLASKDKKPSARDIRLGSRKVRGLSAFASSKTNRRFVRVPAATAGGLYWIFACAGSKARHYPKASCRRSSKRVRIRPAVPANTAAPSIDGRPVDGQVLNARTGRWKGLSPIRYAQQWQRCNSRGVACTNISGATAASYRVSSADVGGTLRVAVIAKNKRGTRTARSRQAGPVAAVAPGPLNPPRVIGAAVLGGTVTADPGTWSGTAPIGLAYQWQSCTPGCANIPGATGSSFTLGQGNVGPNLQVVVTAFNSAGQATQASTPVSTGLWANPVYAGDSTPDPFVVDVGNNHNNYWAFSTGDRFPLLHSTDLLHWTPSGTALRTKPTWAIQTGDYHPWAPSVYVDNNNPCPGTSSGSCYLMYYVSVSTVYGTNCIGVATSSTPNGPYNDRGILHAQGGDPPAGPVGCLDTAGRGQIDPAPFRDPNDGDDSTNRYLYVSTDADPNGAFHPTISVIPLTGDMLSARGPRVPLFAGDLGTWEADSATAATVENPLPLYHSGTYYMLYSGGPWTGAYGMGYATAPSPTGPFTKSPSNPILYGTPAVASPGGGGPPVTGPNGLQWMPYHGRDTDFANPRMLRIDRFTWQPNPSGGPAIPSISGPSSQAQPQLP